MSSETRSAIFVLKYKIKISELDDSLKSDYDRLLKMEKTLELIDPEDKEYQDKEQELNQHDTEVLSELRKVHAKSRERQNENKKPEGNENSNDNIEKPEEIVTTEKKSNSGLVILGVFGLIGAIAAVLLTGGKSK